MNIGVVSGKGGTGKTTLATGLAKVLNAAYVDMDAEEPNGRYFLSLVVNSTHKCNVMVPAHTEKCTYCGICADKCPFSALAVIEKTKRFMLFDDLCHHCGLCVEVCPVEEAIVEDEKHIGNIDIGTHSDGAQFIEGSINIGEATSVPLLEYMKQYIPKEGINILDSSPGASCPVVSVMNASDFILFAGEPTPFGLSDLEVVYQLALDMNKPMGLVINKYIEDNTLHDFADERNIDILGVIPFKREVAEHYSKGGNITDILHDELNIIAKHIMEKIGYRNE